MQRANFLALAASAITASAGGPALAGGARPGSRCLPLRKGIADLVFDFELYLLDGDGKTFRLGDLLGSPVWLSFFTSWCPPCNEEAQRIVELARHYRETGLRVIGVDVKETPDAVRGFRDKHAIDYPIALDETGSVFKSFGFSAFPTHVFLHRRGTISCIFTGDLDTRFMDNEVAVVAEQPHERPQAPTTSATPSALASPNPTR